MDTVEEVIRRYFFTQNEASLVLLHGSFAAQRQTAESDVDVAVLFRQPLAVDELVEKAQDLGKLLRREVDLVDLSGAHGVILQEALVRGKVLLNRDPEVYSRLISRMWREQADDARFAAKTIAERRTLWHTSTSS